MKKAGRIGVVLTLALILILGSSPVGDSSLGRLTLDFFKALFQSEEARQVFDLDKTEAKEVFGYEGESVFL